MTSRRSRAWADQLYSNLLTDGGELTITDLLTGLDAVETKTVVRLILAMTISIPALSENEGAQIIDVGVGVVSADAFAAGSTALPNPQTESDVPTQGWLYRTRGIVSQALPTGGTPTAMWRETMTVNVDIRSGRKVDRGILYMRVLNSPQEGTAQSVRLTGISRCLVLT